MTRHTSTFSMWGAAWLVTAVFILSNSPTPLYVHWQQEIGFSTGTLTVIFVFYIVGLLGTLLIAGQLSDHYGRKTMLLPGLFAALVASFLFGYAQSVLILGIARLLTGIAVGIIVSAGMAAVSELGGSHRRRHSALLASISMVFGAGLGPLFAGVLAQIMPYPIPSVFGIELFILGSALLIAFLLPLQRPRQPNGRSKPLRLRFPRVPSANRRHLAYGIATFGPGITATSFMLVLGPSLLSRLLGVHSPMVAGGMACSMFLVATGVQLALRNRSLRWVFLCSTTSTVFSMACIVTAIYTSSTPMLVAAAFLAGAGQGLGQLGGLTLIGLNVPHTNQAEANAVLNMGGYFPAGLMSVAVGYLIDWLGAESGTTAFCILLAFVAAIGGGFVQSSLTPAKTEAGNVESH